MANNRIYLRCTCGEELLLAKYWPYHGGWTHWTGPQDPEDHLANWLLAHSHDISQWGIEGGAPFSLKYEIEPAKVVNDAR
jgi:hypothetical protein